MYNVFFIESPLQLLSATSARNKFGGKSILIVYLGGHEKKNNNNQILDSLDGGWGLVFYLKKENNFLCLAKTFFVKILPLAFKYRGKVNKYFFGEYRNVDMVIFGEILKPKDKVLLDDGSFTITAQKKYIRNKTYPFQNSKKSKVFFLSCREYHAPNLYSFFDLERYLISGQVNYFELPVKRNISIDNRVVYFFGSKFTENNSIKPIDEIKILSKAIEVYADFEVFYIPHRDESKEKINKVKVLGYKVKYLGGAAETYFDKAEIMPEIVVSYYSTVLYSCFIRFKNVRVKTINVERYLLKEHDKINAKEIYEYYDDLGLDKIVI